MHTLDGSPAFFTGGQICFATNSPAAPKHNILVESLQEIRVQQKASQKWRDSRGFENHFKHGYVLVYLPEDAK